jgi:hypothetical protein
MNLFWNEGDIGFPSRADAKWAVATGYIKALPRPI